MISLDINIMTISDRLGNENTQTRWNTYGHLYPKNGCIIFSVGREFFLSPTLNIIQPFIHSHQPDSLEMDFSNQPDNLYYPFNLF